LLVFPGDNLLTSIGRFGNERRQRIEIGLQDRQVDRRIREFRITGQIVLNRDAVFDDIEVGQLKKKKT